MEDKTIILKENNEEIRKKIKDVGIKVCVCAEFIDACWLDYNPHVTDSVHGVGFWDEEEGINSQKESLEKFLSKLKNPIWCKDVDEFINHIKEFENGKTE